MDNFKISPVSVHQSAQLSPNEFIRQLERGALRGVCGPDDDGHTALFARFLRHKFRQTAISLFLFFIGGLAYWAHARLLRHPLRLGWLILFSILIGLTAGRYLILRYRIKRGWFANNEYEASELILFVRQP
jgi:hypothetical protein